MYFDSKTVLFLRTILRKLDLLSKKIEESIHAAQKLDGPRPT